MVPSLQLIAIIPPEPAYSSVRREQEYIASTWGPQHALRTPPHITIIPPIALSSAETGLLFGMAEAIADSTQSFEMILENFGCFKPRVIFIQPVVPPALMQLYDVWRQALMLRMPHVLDKYPDRPYQPHVTLAHKDVKASQFAPMWEYYSALPFQGSIQVNHFCILRHTTEGWVTERKFSFA